MSSNFLNLRFRTRLALVMFLTLACISAILFVTYNRQEQHVKVYVNGVTSDLMAISRLTDQQIPATGKPEDILKAYTKALQDAGLRVEATLPSGEVVESTDPRQLRKKIKIRKHAGKEGKGDPLRSISAKFPDIDVDPSASQTTYSVQFPIVQGNKVIGYAVVHGVADQIEALLRHTYLVRSLWILSAMLAGLFAVVYLAFRFTKPIDQLVAGAQQVARGNLDVMLPVSGTDEMGGLARTFNQMVENLRENRKLQERLNEAEKSSLLGRFAATVAHEVRNSLNFMNLSIDQIRAKHAGSDGRAERELQRNLANIKDEISRLNHLVNDFLAAGRQARPELALCDLRGVLEEAVALVEKQAQSQSVTIVKDLPADLPAFRADAAQMKTCFLNILTNAVQAMPRGGRIRISARSVEENGGVGKWQLLFGDTGPGIPPEEREKVFAPYFSTKTTGFGLGLAITRKIVEEHGGRIYVEDADSPGTVMAIELPVPRMSVSPASVISASPAA